MFAHQEAATRRRISSAVQSVNSCFTKNSTNPHKLIGLFIYGDLQDITERKKVESALKESDAFLRVIIDSVPDHVAVIDQNGVILQVNEPWRRFALENGPEPGTPALHTDPGFNYMDVFRDIAGSPAEGSNAAREGIKAVLAGTLPSFSMDYPCHSPDQGRWFTMRVAPLEGNRRGAVIAHTNITDQVLANDALRQSEELLKSMTAAVPGVVYQFSVAPDENWKFLFLSKGIENLYEVTAEEVYRDHRVMTERIVPEDRVSHCESIEHSAANMSSWVLDHRIKTLSGKLKWVRGQAVPERQSDGSVLWNGILTDITDRKTIEAELKESEAKFRLIAESTSDGITILDKHGQIQYVSPSVSRQLGYTQAEDLGRSDADVYAIIHPDERDALYREINDAIEKKLPTLTYSYRVRHKSGHFLWREDCTSFRYTSTGDYDGAYVVSRDITERKRMEEKVHQLAYFDSLTHLPNRRMLHDRINQTMAASKRSGRYAAAMMLDLDNFKPLNDQYGHMAGDLLLAEAARRLSACVREVDTVARFGGDEFVVILNDLDEEKAESRRQAQSVAEKIRLALATPYRLSIPKDDQAAATVEHHCSASIGGVLFLGSEATQEDLFRRADTAMYQAKDAGRNTIQFYGLTQSTQL